MVAGCPADSLLACRALAPVALHALAKDRPLRKLSRLPVPLCKQIEIGRVAKNMSRKGRPEPIF